MFDFRRLKEYEKIRNNPEMYVFTSQTRKNYQLLDKILKSDKSLPVSLIGSRGSGKHSLLAALFAKEERKISTIHASEIVQSGKFCFETLTKNLRSVIELKIKENQKIIEGEVVSLSSNKIHLKTMDMDSVFEIGVRMGKELEKERICIGDVIKIYKENCFVTKIGRASGHNASFRSDLLPIVPVPEGECIKNENVESVVTLDELDVINSREDGEEYLFTNQIVSDQIQVEVDRKVNKWIKEGKAFLNKGILIIENCEELPFNALKSIQAFPNNTFSPHVILVFNQPHGITDNLGIKLNFNSYSSEEITQIINSNAKALGEDFQALLCELAQKKGLRFAFKILNTMEIPTVLDSYKKIANLFDF